MVLAASGEGTQASLLSLSLSHDIESNLNSRRPARQADANLLHFTFNRAQHLQEPHRNFVARPSAPTSTSQPNMTNPPTKKERRARRNNFNPYQYHHNSGTPKPSVPIMRLPTELWMQILESVTLEEHLARPAQVERFVEAFRQGSGSEKEEEELVRSLPEFERRAWKATRPYYAIDRSLRAAAQRVFLSGLLLQTCSAPLNQVPHPAASVDSSPAISYEPSVIVRMRPAVDANGELQPTYLPLDVFEQSNFEQRLKQEIEKRNTGTLLQMRLSSLTGVFIGHRMRTMGVNLDMVAGRLQTSALAAARQDSVFKTVRIVELLAAAPHGDREYSVVAEVSRFAEELRKDIEIHWKVLGVKDGVVRILE